MIREFFFRLSKPTPEFFRKLRNVGITVGAIGMALLTASMVLPVGLVSLGGYLVVGGTVMGIISQSTTERWHLQKKKDGRFTKGMIFEEGQ